MSANIAVQEAIGGVTYGDWSRGAIGALGPMVAGDMANQLRAGIKTSGIKKINPEDHPGAVDTILLKLTYFEARAKQ